MLLPHDRSANSSAKSPWGSRRRPRRKHASSRRHGGRGFPRLVLTLAGLTFVGVYGLLTPGKVGDPSDPFYLNCDTARAAGAAPLHAGEPGYRSRLDGDSDGIACEPYP